MKPMQPTVAALVRERTGVAWSRARKLCEEGRVLVDGVRCLDPASRVPEGAVVVVEEGAPKREAGPLAKDAIAFHDRDVVVVDKPAGMLSVADVAGNKDTCADHVRALLRRMRAGDDVPLGVVHRLDRDTSGLMAFTRGALAKRDLAAQFRAHDVDRVYLAIAHGDVPRQTVESDLVLDRGDGLRGSHGHFRRAKGPPPREARHAITRVQPLERLRGATLVECRLETGRQHQIRIHLSELGHPLVGESVYIRDYPGARIDAPRAMLHARRLGFTHPRTGERLSWESEPPEDFTGMLATLRGED
jgi:23S rRNA pseudouridine1911/1915/1917 synthase